MEDFIFRRGKRYEKQLKKITELIMSERFAMQASAHFDVNGKPSTFLESFMSMMESQNVITPEHLEELTPTLLEGLTILQQKDMEEMIENYKDKLNKQGATNNNDKGSWITVKGTPVFIPDGENKGDVIKKQFDKLKKSSSPKKETTHTIIDESGKKQVLTQKEFDKLIMNQSHPTLKYDYDPLSKEDRKKYATKLKEIKFDWYTSNEEEQHNIIKKFYPTYQEYFDKTSVVYKGISKKQLMNFKERGTFNNVDDNNSMAVSVDKIKAYDFGHFVITINKSNLDIGDPKKYAYKNDIVGNTEVTPHELELSEWRLSPDTKITDPVGIHVITPMNDAQKEEFEKEFGDLGIITHTSDANIETFFKESAD